MVRRAASQRKLHHQLGVSGLSNSHSDSRPLAKVESRPIFSWYLTPQPHLLILTVNSNIAQLLLLSYVNRYFPPWLSDYRSYGMVYASFTLRIKVSINGILCFPAVLYVNVYEICRVIAALHHRSTHSLIE